MKKMILALAAIVALAACSDKASFEEVDVQRGVANENARFNAKRWVGENGFSHLDILARGDSTQQATCPQGDGWASVDLIDPKNKQTQVALKCSTVSANVGCIKAEDFKARPTLSQQENKCNADLPRTLKKLAE